MNLTLKIGTISLVSLIAFGCGQPAVVNSNANVNTSLDNKTNTNSVNSNLTNASDMNTSGSISEVKEPEKYQAKLNLSLQAENAAGKNSAFPELISLDARDGANRRMEFTLPNNQKIIYLETGGKSLVVLPDRKQYAELNENSTGVNVRSLMMPDQIVKQMQNIKGVKRAGEETVDGRSVIKYTYQSTTETKTQAGNVATESYFLVDKETGLPIRSETVSESQSGNVQGFKGVKFVTQMSDIKTEVPADLFAEPTGLTKVDEAQIRGQIDLLFSVVMNVITQAAKAAQNAPATNSNTNTVSNSASNPAQSQ